MHALASKDVDFARAILAFAGAYRKQRLHWIICEAASQFMSGQSQHSGCRAGDGGRRGAEPDLRIDSIASLVIR